MLLPRLPATYLSVVGCFNSAKKPFYIQGSNLNNNNNSSSIVVASGSVGAGAVVGGNISKDNASQTTVQNQAIPGPMHASSSTSHSGGTATSVSVASTSSSTLVAASTGSPKGVTGVIGKAIATVLSVAGDASANISSAATSAATSAAATSAATTSATTSAATATTSATTSAAATNAAATSGAATSAAAAATSATTASAVTKSQTSAIQNNCDNTVRFILSHPICKGKEHALAQDLGLPGQVLERYLQTANQGSQSLIMEVERKVRLWITKLAAVNVKELYALSEYCRSQSSSPEMDPINNVWKAVFRILPSFKAAFKEFHANMVRSKAKEAVVVTETNASPASKVSPLSSSSADKTSPRCLLPDDKERPAILLSSTGAVQEPHISASLAKLSPIKAIPVQTPAISSTPTSAIPVQTPAVSSTPTSAIPVQTPAKSSTPTSAIPVRTPAITSTPTSTIPVQTPAITSTPTSAIPVQTPAKSSTPTSAIPVQTPAKSSTPTSAIPVQTPMSASSVKKRSRQSLTDGTASSRNSSTPNTPDTPLRSCYAHLKVDEMVMARQSLNPLGEQYMAKIIKLKDEFAFFLGNIVGKEQSSSSSSSASASASAFSSTDPLEYNASESHQSTWPNASDPCILVAWDSMNYNVARSTWLRVDQVYPIYSGKRARRSIGN